MNNEKTKVGNRCRADAIFVNKYREKSSSVFKKSKFSDFDSAYNFIRRKSLSAPQNQPCQVTNPVPILRQGSDNETLI